MQNEMGYENENSDDEYELQPLPELPEPQGQERIFYSQYRKRLMPVSIMFADRENRTIYERWLHEDDIPPFTEEEMDNELDTLTCLSTLLCEGSASLKSLHTCLNHYYARTGKPEMSFEEFEHFMRMRSHFFTIYKYNMVENTSFGTRRYFPSVVCITFPFPNGTMLHSLRRPLLGLPYAGDSSNAETGVRSDELFWMRKPDVIEILNFFKKHHTIFSVEVARKVHETDPLDYIIKVKPEAHRIPSLFDSRIFLKMPLPTVDKSLAGMLHGKLNTNQIYWGTAQCFDAQGSRVYIHSKNVHVPNIAEAFPHLKAVVMTVNRIYDDSLPFVATNVTKAPGRADEAQLLAQEDVRDFVEEQSKEDDERKTAMLAVHRKLRNALKKRSKA